MADKKLQFGEIVRTQFLNDYECQILGTRRFFKPIKVYVFVLTPLTVVVRGSRGFSRNDPIRWHI